jgi:hypothetical protein
LRIEIDSMPFEIDVVERRIRQLEIRRAAGEETDGAGKQRLGATPSCSRCSKTVTAFRTGRGEKDAIATIKPERAPQQARLEAERRAGR